MPNIVYLDVLLVVNFVIDYLLLLGTGRLCGRGLHRGRLLSGALFGAVSTLIIFFPPLPFWAMTGYKLATAFVMAALAYRWLGGWQLLKDTLVLFTTSFMLAGACIALWMSGYSKGMLLYNGVTYFQISSLVLLGTTAVAYLLIGLFTRIFHRRQPGEEELEAQLLLDGKLLVLPAMVDTGNRLREPFSGSPVVVCCLEDVSSILPLQLTEAILTGNFGLCTTLQSRWQPRMVPYRALGKNGTLAAVRLQSLQVSTRQERYQVEDVFLAISPRPLGGKGRLILHGELISLQYEYRR